MEVRALKREEVWVLYPEYFDSRFSRRLGRKVPLDISIYAPSLEELLEAVKRAGLKIARIERDKSHPANWIESRGRIVVLKSSSSKRKTLLTIARLLRIVRKKFLEKKRIEEAKRKRKKDVDKYLERVLKKRKK